MPLSNHLVIIASVGKGFGRSLAVAFSKALLSKLHFVLIGQCEEDLQATADIVAALRPQTVTSDIKLCDLSDPAAMTTLAEQLFSGSFAAYTHVTFINNAQTVHPIGTVDSGMDPTALSKAMQLNISSPMFLTAEFVKVLTDPTRSPSRAAVVNISSLWATEAAASFGVYAASKAAMEMFYEVLAKETASSPLPIPPPSCHAPTPSPGDTAAIKVLNYSPGPIDSSLQAAIRDSPKSDPSWKQSCCQMKEDGTLIHPDKSARKCALLIIQELYDTGDHIDFYDQIEGVDYHRKVITTCCSNPNCQCGVNCRCSSDNGPQCGGCQSFMLYNR